MSHASRRNKVDNRTKQLPFVRSRIGSLGVRAETSNEGYTRQELDAINSELRILAVQTARLYWAQRPAGRN